MGRVYGFKKEYDEPTKEAQSDILSDSLFLFAYNITGRRKYILGERLSRQEIDSAVKRFKELLLEFNDYNMEGQTS